MKIELLWFEDCPNHETAYALLEDILRERGIDETIERIEVPDLETGERTSFAGSPTIRIDGIDVDPSYKDSGDYTPRCRLYATDRGLTGVPERRWIEDTLDRLLEAA